MNTGTGPNSTSLIERVKGIILRPADEWNKIAGEDLSSREILTGFIVPLALIGPLAGFIGGQVFGYFPFGVFNGAIVAVSAFFLSLIAFLALALIADFLSPKFGGEASYFRSFKLVAYASTAAWIAGIFALVPALGVFSLLGLYSIYLFYVGTGPMLSVPKDKALAFTATVFVAAMLINIVIVSLSAANIQLLSGMGLIDSTQLPHNLPR